METEALIQIAAEEEKRKYLIFEVGGASYGIDISFVTEIIEMLPITLVPNIPACIKGIINIRGTIVPVIDMRQKFNLEPSEYTERTCIVSLNRENENLGLIVDGVDDVIELAEKDTLPPPGDAAERGCTMLKAIGKSNGRVILIVDAEKLYTDERDDT